MNEQKQIGKFHAVLIENLPEMTGKQRQRWIGDPIGFQKFLSGLVETVTKTVNYITATFKDQIDYGRSIADSVKAGKYDRSNDNITDENFSGTEKGWEEVEYVLFHFNKVTESENNLTEMNKVDCDPATMKDLLNFGEKHPKIQLEFPVVALGFVIMLHSNRRVGYLRGDGSERHLYLCSFDSDWNDNYRFLGVRRKSSGPKV